MTMSNLGKFHVWTTSVLIEVLLVRKLILKSLTKIAVDQIFLRLR